MPASSDWDAVLSLGLVDGGHQELVVSGVI